MATVNLGRLRDFAIRLDELIETSQGDESIILSRGTDNLRELVSHDDWLPVFCARADPKFYQQYLLYSDLRSRFSIVSFVWGPGQSTPIHDHTVWGLIGMLRGAERCQRYERRGDRLVAGERACLKPSEVDAVSPRMGDIHRVANAYDDRVSISIHVYGGNIGRIRRHILSEDGGTTKEFISGYANAVVPNLWRDGA